MFWCERAGSVILDQKEQLQELNLRFKLSTISSLVVPPLRHAIFKLF